MDYLQIFASYNINNNKSFLAASKAINDFKFK